jgi:hypothetical protein
MNFTPAARPYFNRIDRQTLAAANDAERRQRQLLAELIGCARHTSWGQQHNYNAIADYEQYRSQVAINSYESLHGLIREMVDGGRDILWPGVCRRFAQSSGTSDGKSKYIPLTDRSLKRCHYRGGSEVVARYLALNPDSHLFAGKSFILGGSYANELNLAPGVHVGDLSASLIDCINPVANLVRTPGKQIALMADWEAKLEKLVEATLHANVTNISGVPSWFYTVLRRVMKAAGATELHQVWPNLEVFFHGGIAFEPYRKQYDAIIDPDRMRYLETYNASEGFFAVQSDPADKAMMLLMDADVFYEFIPLDALDNDTHFALPSWEVKEGETYALAITSSNGLWRYLIGDTVTITQLNPLKIRIAGRTKSFINAFGEELMVHNADAAIVKACAATAAEVANYTAAPVYAEGNRRGRHQWLIEFNRRPADIEQFADILDKALQDENSDYQAKRTGGLFLDRLSINAVAVGTFDRWLASTGKLGGQRKVPRLRNNRDIVDAILSTINPTNQ